MPNIIPLEEIKLQLPPFIKIIDETYRGIRYKAKFIDLEYNNEEFEAKVNSVIKWASGCKSRSAARNKQSNKRSGRIKGGAGNRVPIEEIKSKLPEYVIIEESSYKGVGKKAKFYDIEYKEYFEGVVANVLRAGKAYCPSRRAVEFKKTVTLTIDEIDKNIREIFNNRIILVRESFVCASKSCEWILDGNTRIKSSYNAIRSGKVLYRNILGKWRDIVKTRDGHCCQNCASIFDLSSHHIKTWQFFKEERFNINNGITLCERCHSNYHSKFKNKETVENFCEWMGDEKAPLILERLAAPMICVGDGLV